MKKLLAILMMAFLVSGCAGVMNEYDRDAAQAHYKAQEALLKAVAAQLSQPACRVSGATGADFKLECYAGSNGIDDLKITQYQQPEHPAAPIAKGLGRAIEVLPTAAATTVLGVKALDTMGKIADSAGGTTYNQSVSGTGNSAVTKTSSIATGNMGDGNTLSGMTEINDSYNPVTTTTTTSTDDHSTVDDHSTP